MLRRILGTSVHESSCVITSFRKYFERKYLAAAFLWASASITAQCSPQTTAHPFSTVLLRPLKPKYRRSPVTLMLNESSLLNSYLEIPTERHMWNWEWFSGSTGSHLHSPTTSHPPFKASSWAFVLLCSQQTNETPTKPRPQKKPVSLETSPG